MARKPSRKTLKRKADKLFSQWIRNLSVCEWCGKQDATLQCAHIFSRQFMVTRYDENNALCLCAGCHWKGHKQPLEFAEFVKELYGTKKYNSLRRKAKTSIKKVNMEEVCKKYSDLLD